ncbi:MAG TPA: hypothetical protein VI864_05165 [Candidatus Bathyarchaeia archaeon]|nr:hypothetical protein [Candidatus Bathyarchaeia archaeon]
MGEKMAESSRSYFNIRYAAPGYTFILIIVLITLPQLIEIFSKFNIKLLSGGITTELLAVLLAFVSLLGGFAMGFLVSQVWYVFFSYFIREHYGRYPQIRNFLEGTLDRRINDRYLRFFIIDYIHRFSDEKTLTYTQRRWDLMNTCSSTFAATALGALFGYVIRFCILGNKIDLVPTSSIAIMMVIFAIFLIFLALYISRFNELEKRGWTTRNIAITMTFFGPLFIIALTALYLSGSPYDGTVVLFVTFLLVVLFVSSWTAGRAHAVASEFSIRDAVTSSAVPIVFIQSLLQDHYGDASEPLLTN